MRTILTTILLISQVISFAQYFNGVALDFVTGERLENVILVINQNDSIQTNEKGTFEFKIKNTNRIDFHCPGYLQITLQGMKEPDSVTIFFEHFYLFKGLDSIKTQVDNPRGHDIYSNENSRIFLRKDDVGFHYTLKNGKLYMDWPEIGNEVFWEDSRYRWK